MSAAIQMNQHPDPNELSAFVDGTLSAERRTAVEAHLADCAECRDDFLAVSEYLASTGEVVPIDGGRPRWRGAAAAGIAAAAIVAFALFLTPAGSRFSEWRNTRALVAAAESLPERPLSARTSIEATYKRHRAMRGGGEHGFGPDAVITTALELTEKAEENPTPANLHAAGIALLMNENTKIMNYKKAGVALLEQALTTGKPGASVESAIETSTDAKLLNDLAAGYHALRQDDLARRAATRAWSLEKSPTTAWTRAVVLDTREAWNDYLAIDGTSEWSAEAREMLELK